MGQITEIDAQTTKQWLDADTAVLFDVREKDEYDRERIAGSSLNPLSSFSAEEVLKCKEKKVVLHCRAGVRSMDAAHRAVAAGATEIYSLRGGIKAWKAAGFPVEPGKARQPEKPAGPIKKLAQRLFHP